MSKITVSTFSTAAGSRWSGSTAYLRVYYYGSNPAAFSFSTGEVWSPSLENFYREISCTLASNVITVPNIILDSTPDITNRPDVFVRMVLLDSSRTVDSQILLADRWDIPVSLGSTVTFEQLRVHNETPVTRYDDRASLSRTAIEALLAPFLATLAAPVITQTPTGAFSAEQALSALQSGLLYNTTGTGVLSTVANGTEGQALFMSGGVPVWSASGTLSARVVYASRNGAVLDSDLETGGGTDDTAALQDLLDLASGGDPVCVVVDGVGLSGPLNVHANTHLKFPAGCGLYLKDGSNRALLRNANPMGSGTPVDTNITIEGGTFNGNPAGQVGVGAVNRREEDGTLIGLLQFFGVTNFTVKNVRLNHSKSIALHLSNCQDFWLEDIVVDNEDALEHQQGGVQFEGFCSRGHLIGLKGRTGDDLFAFTPDGALYVEPPFTGLGPFIEAGDVTDIIVDGVVARDPTTLCSVFADVNLVDRIHIANVTGEAKTAIFWTSVFSAGNVGTMSMVNVNVQLTETPYPNETAGFAFYGRYRHILLRNITVGLHPSQAVIRAKPSARIDDLVVEGLFLRNDDNVAYERPPVLIEGKVKRLKGSNWSWQHSAALDRELEFVSINHVGAQVTELNLRNAETSRVSNLIRHVLGNVGKVRLNGVTMTDGRGGAAFNQVSTNTIDGVTASGFDGENASAFLTAGPNHRFPPQGGAFAADTTAPTFVSASTSTGSYVVRVTFSEPVNSGNYGLGAVVKVNTVAQTFTDAARRPGDTAVVEYVIATPVPSGATVTWEYSAVTGATTDLAGNPLPTTAAQAVTVSGTTRIFDRFTAADGTANAGRTPSHVTTGGAAWATTLGNASTVKIAGNRLLLDDTAGTEKRATINAGVADGTFSFEAEADYFTADDGFIQAVVRAQDASNNIVFRVENAGQAFLYKVSGGGPAVQIGTPQPLAASTLMGKRSKYEVVLSGNSITCKRDGVTMITATDAYLNTQTNFAVSAYKAVVYVDEVKFVA